MPLMLTQLLGESGRRNREMGKVKLKLERKTVLVCVITFDSPSLGDKKSEGPSEQTQVLSLHKNR